jgi:hypothetical protein
MLNTTQIQENSWNSTQRDKAASLAYIERVKLKPFYINVLKTTLRMIPGMTKGKAYELKKIWGKANWGLLERWQQIDSGVYVSALVATKQLPLAEVEWAHEYPKKYMTL